MKVTLEKEKHREIYFAYKKIFHGQNALFRKNKPIQQLVKATKNQSIVQDVRKNYEQDVIVHILRVLLSARVFESETRANMYFSSAPPSPPTTAEPSPSTAPEPNTTQIDAPKPAIVVGKQKQTAGPVASETETEGVAFTNLNSLLGISPPELGKDETMRDGTITPPTPEFSDAEREGDKNVCPNFTCSSDFPVSVRKPPVSWTEFLTLYTRTNDRTPRTPPISFDISSDISSNISSVISSGFSSVILSDTSSATSSTTSYEDTIVPQEVDPPHRTQILILSRMQQILEAACFKYAEDMMPSVLKQMGWTCAEAGELNIWASHLRKKTAILGPRAAAYGINIPVQTILNSCVQIRHFAVHRQELHGAQLIRLAEHAVALCTILRTPEHEHVYTLQRIRDAIKTEMSSLAMFKRQCTTRLGETLGRVTECRTELLAMEQEVLNWASKRRTELDAMEQEGIRSSRIEFDHQKTATWENVEALLCKKDIPPPVETQAAETQATDVSDADLHHIHPELPQDGKDDQFEGIVSCFPLFPTLEACHTVGQILRWVVTKAWSVTLIIAEFFGEQQNNTWISVFWMAVFFMVLLGLYCMGLVHIVQMTHN
ncbi:uncharacterized protein B0J16DRAFT_410742 [Fusarium flagelliforme]|uniref:Ubiquinol-cytochrome-c reductase cytochrome c1 n=1 Tax=Fusarium flagelliforme TaxID=2675880 RepID=A0A395MU51_9HYPO|nr:uncharacterized protein B0J16DRAFT_410742 [Fusarium flagelliforme]KAH7191990.1 hypothetical protein B0J16DRAFT_410742 [Fusarium flagelliforme]RFN51471.1 ubiquinol-cytochrome-c reductase cytochrome c1 [Fusarium flagelliforme]